MKIYVIRHGQTTGDIEDRYGGDYDDHLTALGIAQAKDLAEKAGNFGIEMLFVSPKIRAQETAKILQGALGVGIETKNDFRERNQNGILTGMTRTEAKAKYPELVEKVRDRFNTIQGAEDYESFRNRVVNAFNDVVNSGYSTVGIVTHGGPIRRIFEDVFMKEGKVDVADCGWLLIDYNDGKASLIKSEGIDVET